MVEIVSWYLLRETEENYEKNSVSLTSDPAEIYTECLLNNNLASGSVVFNLFIPVPPDVISFQLCAPKVFCV
jgi:hypothetical protein